jgi:hypothetical protein
MHGRFHRTQRVAGLPWPGLTLCDDPGVPARVIVGAVAYGKESQVSSQRMTSAMPTSGPT